MIDGGIIGTLCLWEGDAPSLPLNPSPDVLYVCTVDVTIVSEVARVLQYLYCTQYTYTYKSGRGLFSR